MHNNMFRIVSIIAILAAILLFGIAKAKRTKSTHKSPRASKLGTLFGLLTLIATIPLTASGFRASILDQQLMTGLPLLLHVAAGSVFIVSLALWAVCRSESNRIILLSADAQRTNATDNLRAILWWCFVTAGLVTTLTILASMVPIFGAHGLELLYVVHRWAALLLLIAGIGFLLRR